jgi:hypothetical protein
MRLKNITFVFLILFCNILQSQNLAINEVVSSNSTIIGDEDNEFEDFIEIYNYGSVAINLENFGLTDDENEPFQWVFPNITLQPNEYLLVWASKKDRTDPTQQLHANFKISSGGETIILSDSNETILNQIELPALESDTSLGRFPNGTGTFKVFQNPTPSQANIDEIEPVHSPDFSKSSGFFNNTVLLELTHLDPEVTILYTLDGSEPKPENIQGVNYSYKNSYQEAPDQSSGVLLNQSFETLTYNTTLSLNDRSADANKLANISTTWSYNPTYFPNQAIKKATVVKARALKNGALSPVVSHTFFISSANTFQSNLPVVSISFDENKFFDYNNGIYVAGKDFDTWRSNNPNTPYFNSRVPANWNNRGRDYEKLANFQYFKNNNLILNQNIGVRIHGGWSRSFPIKSLRLYARSDYDLSNKFNFSFFGEDNSSSFKRIMLRNGGTDQQDAIFRDPFSQRISEHMKIDTQDYQPIVLYLNGEFWGIHNLREHYDKHYFERVYGIEENDLNILEKNSAIVEGDDVHYNNMRNYIINNDLSNPTHYEYVKTQMDVENFADYYIAQIFIANWDWPHNNNKYFRKKTIAYEPNAPFGQDGRWRWVLQDVDYGFGGPHSTLTTHMQPDFDMMFWTTNPSGNSLSGGTWVNSLFINLLENETFKNHFINRFSDQLNTGFLPSRILPIIYEMRDEIATEMSDHNTRWTNVVTNWEGQIQKIIDFSEQRPAFQRQHIRETFSISQDINLNVNVSHEEHGYVKVNTINLKESTIGVSKNPYPWSGVYFQNIPITLTAKTKPGYQFSHWSGASESPNETITITPEDNIIIKANYEPITDLSEQLVYYWLIDNEVENDTPLSSLTSTYSIKESDAVINFESAMVGYPLESTDSNWRKSSMERRNKPTELNYFPIVNNNIVFENSSMRGLQIKQPFQTEDKENKINFQFSTESFEKIKVSFAVLDEGASNSLIVEYLDESYQWVSNGLSSATYPITSAYQLVEIDFSTIIQANNNLNFQYRIRFAGSDMTSESGNKVTFNNIMVVGTPIAGSCIQQNFVRPTFAEVPSSCEGETLSPLPLFSENGISGSWTPELDNTKTTNYTFTPDPGQCTTQQLTNLEIVVNSCELSLEGNNRLAVSIHKSNKSTIRITGFNRSEEVSLGMYSINGIELFDDFFLTKTINDIAIPNFSAGIYIIRLTTNKKSYIKKIFIE